MLLFLHVLGAVLFLGNIVTGAFWKVRAHYGKQDLMAIHLTVKNIMLADYVFTIPGILLLLIPGYLMAANLGKMIRYSEESVKAGRQTEAYKRVSKKWDIFGSIGTILPLISLILMVWKPGI